MLLGGLHQNRLTPLQDTKLTDQTSNTTSADDDEAFEAEAMDQYEADYGSDVDDKEETKT